MSKSCLSVITLLLIIIAGGYYRFILQNDTSKSSDTRELIPLTAAEKAIVLTEMRTFLTSTQQIIKGITDADMALVASQAKRSGKAAQAEIPAGLAKKLPAPFKKLGSDTHVKFDQIAMDAEDLGDGEHALSQLSVLLQNCTSCHQLYRF